jgi:hypothetical protein
MHNNELGVSCPSPYRQSSGARESGTTSRSLDRVRDGLRRVPARPHEGALRGTCANREVQPWNVARAVCGSHRSALIRADFAAGQRQASTDSLCVGARIVRNRRAIAIGVDRAAVRLRIVDIGGRGREKHRRALGAMVHGCSALTVAIASRSKPSVSGPPPASGQYSWVWSMILTYRAWETLS